MVTVYDASCLILEKEKRKKDARQVLAFVGEGEALPGRVKCRD